jgi:hypothetical protein
VIERITVGATSLMAALVAATGLVRWAVAPVREPGRHRGTPQFVPLDDLLGPPSPYTSYDTLTDVLAPGPIRQGFGLCARCAGTTAGIVTRDGFTCGQCLTPAGAA